MKPEITRQLIEINHLFYQSCAESFSKTRQRVQPGVMRIINQTLANDKPVSILDLGCGNGELAKVLLGSGRRIKYRGLDFSLPLMESGSDLPSTDSFQASFMEADLLRDEWSSRMTPGEFDRVFCFAVLHHFPGVENRIRFIQQVHELLAPDGVFAFSVWQFLNSPRLVKRIQPWDRAGLTPDQVDGNDFLLDWRAECEERPLRYVHHFTVQELEEIRSASGFRLLERFTSDGHTHDLGEYQIWAK